MYRLPHALVSGSFHHTLTNFASSSVALLACYEELIFSAAAISLSD